MLLGRVLKVRRWWDEVDPQLILGARPIGRDPFHFKDLRVTGVVNTCEEFEGPVAAYAKLGIEQLWIPTVDFNHPSRENVVAGADFIQRHAEQAGRVYVHCKAGRARSATIALWWLVRYRELAPEVAQQVLLKARPHANPKVYMRPVIQELYAQLQRGDQREQNQ